MRIAIIGSGVSGLVAAHLLQDRHELSVFEARTRVGGHVNTVEVEEEDGSRVAVDTGFIVYNEQTYPLFSTLLGRLGTATQTSNMSFGVRSDRTGVEYSSANVRTLFAQKRNLVRPGFHSMLRDILRFNRESGPAVRNGSANMSLGEYLTTGGFSRQVAENYLVPMGSALWSIPQGKVLDMPVDFFVRFFENHVMLTVDDQPQWRVIRGGSARYVEDLVAPFADRVRKGRPVRRVERRHAHVSVDGEMFDHVVFACHSDQALRVRVDEGAAATVTYNMNELQTIKATRTYCVTLNATDLIDPESILYKTEFSHPIYTRAGTEAQALHGEISGVDRTHYCGAYWGNGFHEDGVRSAVRVAEHFGCTL